MLLNLLAQLDSQVPNFKSGVIAYQKDSRNLEDIINIFLELINAILPVIAGLALLVFLWGLAKFIFRIGGADGEKAVTDGKNLMKWGLIALFIMLSFWAIIGLVYEDLGFGLFIGLPFLPEY